MSLRAALATLLVLTVLAGCLGGDEGPEPGPTPTPTGSPSSTTSTTSSPPPPPIQTLDLLLAFDFAGCQGLSVQQERPLADVQALLPEGFTAAPPPDAPSGVGYGALAIDLYRCASLDTPAVSVPSTYVGLEYTYVARPVGHVPQAPDAPVQEYLFRMLAGDDVLALLWPAAGYDTYNGTANVTVLVQEDPVPARQSTARVDPDYFLVAPGAGLDAAGGSRSQAFARYTQLGDGSILLWTGTYGLPAAASGPATVEVADDDPFIAYATPATPQVPGLPPLPSRPTWAGVARHVDDGAVRGQDLRRIFP